MSLELLSVSNVKTEPHIKVKVAGGWQVTQNEVKSVYYIRMRSWTWPCLDPADECTLASQIADVHTVSMDGWLRFLKKMWQGQLLWRVDYLMRGNQLECYSSLWTFIHLAWPLLNFYDGLWLFRGREISVNGDCSALLQMYYLPYDTSSNQREPCGPLIDGLCVGFEGGKKRWGRRVEGLGEKGAGVRGGGGGGRVSQMSSTLKEN